MQRFVSSTTRSLPLLSAFLLLAGCWAGAANAACGALSVDNAWLPSAPPGVSVMAAYFEATNTGNSAIKLTAVSSPQFERASMHQTVVDDDGMASMQPVETITLAPDETTTFEPGGYHVMLFQPVKTLSAGDSVTLALHCGSSEASRSVTAEVRSRMATGGVSSHSGHMQHKMDHEAMQHGMDHGGMHTEHGVSHDTHHDQMQHDMAHEHMKHDMKHDG